MDSNLLRYFKGKLKLVLENKSIFIYTGPQAFIHKDNDNAYQDHGNAVVPLLPAGGLYHVKVADVGDGSVDQAVGQGQNEEGKESHHKKVCKKDVPLDI